MARDIWDGDKLKWQGNVADTFHQLVGDNIRVHPTSQYGTLLTKSVPCDTQALRKHVMAMSRLIGTGPLGTGPGGYMLLPKFIGVVEGFLENAECSTT